MYKLLQALYTRHRRRDGVCRVGDSLAGETGLEPATYGFGDRCAANCATPLFRLRRQPPYAANYPLFCLTMQGVLAAPIAEFVEFETIRIVAAILLSGVITFLALGASKVNHHTNIFLSHVYLSLNRGGVARPYASIHLIKGRNLIQNFGNDTP